MFGACLHVFLISATITVQLPAKRKHPCVIVPCQLIVSQSSRTPLVPSRSHGLNPNETCGTSRSSMSLFRCGVTAHLCVDTPWLPAIYSLTPSLPLFPSTGQIVEAKRPKISSSAFVPTVKQESWRVKLIWT